MCSPTRWKILLPGFNSCRARNKQAAADEPGTVPVDSPDYFCSARGSSPDGTTLTSEAAFCTRLLLVYLLLIPMCECYDKSEIKLWKCCDPVYHFPKEEGSTGVPGKADFWDLYLKRLKSP